MTTADGLPPLREVIAAHGLSARRTLGQNFLLDLNLTRRIARAAGDLSGCTVLEVGPGPGGLTRALLIEGAKHVVAIERDPRCLPALDEIAARWPGRLTVLAGDALQIDPARHLAPPARIVANLPYNIGTELLVRWIARPDWPPPWDSMVLMFQREVAGRIIAAPGSRAYGRLSVLAQWRTDPRAVFDLPPAAFTPPPKVTSTVLRLRVRPEPAFPARLEDLERVVAAAFNQRRKMLRSSLAAVSRDPEALLARAGIDPRRRAETLTPAEFGALARALREA
ncbi:MAG: ribosomal RNA small subunit methyltransferase A [Paracoccaceae bacterium]|nr:MAG: ribosomal RNA small subunit methyltransferase A [Paracoccaceae bacterium]